MIARICEGKDSKQTLAIGDLPEVEWAANRMATTALLSYDFG